MENNEAMEVVLACLASVMESHDVSPAHPIGPDTPLMGRESALDSLALVDLLLDVEGQVSDKTDTALTLANEQALSRSSSPFRSAQTLADYVVELLAQDREAPNIT